MSLIRHQSEENLQQTPIWPVATGDPSKRYWLRMKSRVTTRKRALYSSRKIRSEKKLSWEKLAKDVYRMQSRDLSGSADRAHYNAGTGNQNGGPDLGFGRPPQLLAAGQSPGR